MGNNRSQERHLCFKEIQFVLRCFELKYKEYNNFPKYGLYNMIKDLNDNSNINWKLLREFLKNFYRWRLDTQFIITMNSSNDMLHSILGIQNNMNLVTIGNSYVQDIIMLEIKIKEIIEKYKFLDKYNNI